MDISLASRAHIAPVAQGTVPVLGRLPDSPLGRAALDVAFSLSQSGRGSFETRVHKYNQKAGPIRFPWCLIRSTKRRTGAQYA